MSAIMQRLGRVLADLRRRRVFRVAVAYVLVGWLILEVAGTTFQLLDLPRWTGVFVLVLVALGFPAAILLAWAYDITPDGVERTTPQAVTAHGARDPVGHAASEEGPADVSRLVHDAIRDAERHVARSADPDVARASEHDIAIHRRTQRLLASALDLPESERAAYVRSAAGSDAELLGDVLSLLDAHERAGILDRPPLPLTGSTGGPAAGRVVGSYEILDEQGGGGMGVIYRARDRRLQRIVALKFLPPHLSDSEEAKRHLLAEARAAAALDHPHVCTLLEIGEADGHVFLAMPYYDGETLKRRLTRGPLPVPEALDLAVQAASGLGAAHGKGIIHRDIKPANLIITRDGVLKILDFGIAKLASEAAVTGATPGTAGYMSPEQVRGEEVDARTDVWSLGVVLFESLTGRRPFTTTASATADPPSPDLPALYRSDVPSALHAVLRRALAHDAAGRYHSGAELHDALAALLRDAGFGERAPAEGDAEAGGELPPEGERRQATVVLSTIGGYAALHEAAAMDDIQLALERVRAAAEELATRFGGRLNGFEDDRIELVFGVPVSHEDHCFRAIRAALELHERVRSIEVPGSRESPLVLISGIDAGQLLAQPAADGQRLRLLGEPMRAAARLQAHAGPDELWITPACLRMVGPFFDTQPREALALGGGAFDTPHRVLRLSGLRTRLEASQRVGLTSYVGRAAELAHLQNALAGARSGRGQATVIIGEAGVGKSRLLHELRHSAGDSVRFIEGRCQSYGSSVAYIPFIDVLRSITADAATVRGGSRSDTATRAAAVADAIHRIGPDLDELTPLYLHLLSLSHASHPLPAHLHGEALRHAMDEALAGLITVLTRTQPIVLLLEDWHWADDASRTVLNQILEVGTGHALFVVVSTRPHAAVSAELSRLTVLPIEPFGPDASSDMLRTVLGAHSVPVELAEHIHARTGGNPFFIEEVGRTLIEEGAVRVESGVVVTAGLARTLHLPDTVESVIRARLDRLDRDTREVARVASAVGHEFERRLLEQALDSRSRMPHALQTLKAAGLIQQVRVVPDAAYRFNHALTQEVAYASLLERQRVDVHARVAHAIERVYESRLDEHYDRLADHFGRAGIWNRAVHYGIRAADRLRDLSAFGDALEQLERCEEWLGRMDGAGEDDDLLGEVLLRQERMCETLGLRARQQLLIDRLIALLEGSGDTRRLSEVYLRQGDLFTLLRRFGDAEHVLQESLRLRRELNDAALIRHSLRSLGLLCWHADRPQDAIAYIEETLRLDRETDDVDALVSDLSNLGAVLKSMGEITRARATLEEALACVEGNGGAVENSLKECYILHNLANVHRQLGETAVARDYLERARHLTERARLPVQVSYHFTSLAHVCLQEGRIEESLDFYRQAVEMGRRARYTPGLSQTLRMLGEVLVGIGREEEALPHLVEAAQLFAQLEDRVSEGALWRQVARIHAALGADRAALEAWRRTQELEGTAKGDAADLETLVGIAFSARRAGLALDEVTAAHRAALDRAESLGDARVGGRVLNSLGILAWEQADYGGALRHFEAGLAIYTQLSDHHGAGLMLNSIAVTLKAMGRADEARVRLAESIALHRRSGSHLLEGHARAALGDMELEVGDAGRALEQFTASLVLREEARDRAGEAWMHLRIAAAQRALGADGAAAPHVLAARRIAQELGDVELSAACAASASVVIH